MYYRDDDDYDDTYGCLGVLAVVAFASGFVLFGIWQTSGAGEAMAAVWTAASVVIGVLCFLLFAPYLSLLTWLIILPTLFVLFGKFARHLFVGIDKLFLSAWERKVGEVGLRGRVCILCLVTITNAAVGALLIGATWFSVKSVQATVVARAKVQMERAREDELIEEHLNNGKNRDITPNDVKVDVSWWKSLSEDERLSLMCLAFIVLPLAALKAIGESRAIAAGASS